MKRTLICVFLLICFSQTGLSQYKIADIIAENKVQIEKPYKYDGFLMKEFSFELINKLLPQEFIAFKGQRYRLIFCSSSFEEQVIVRIYDKEKPEVLLAEKIIDQNNRSWLYEPLRSTTYYITYEVPPSNTDVEHRACMLMLIGFRD